MKILAALVPLALLGAAPVPYYANPDAIVRVECNKGTGTAVKVGKYTYITAAHVAGESGCAIKGEPIRNVELAGDRDFAVFHGPRSDAVVPVKCDRFRKGRTYLSVGYAHGWPVLTKEPLIYSGVEVGGYPAFIGSVIPGMSGGPLLDRDGSVVGVNVMRWPSRVLAMADTDICKKGN